jgi:hypothetical protein
MPLQIKQLGNVSQSRNEFYNYGLGMALVLDRIAPEWQKKYFDPGEWLDDLLHDATRKGEQASRLLPAGVLARRWVPTTSRVENENADGDITAIFRTFTCAFVPTGGRDARREQAGTPALRLRLTSGTPCRSSDAAA